MSFENYFPLWNDLNTVQKKVISDNLITRDVKKGTIIHNGNLDCTGLLLVKSGQLRTYILSDEGREITLYRLFDMDMCLLSASCIMQSIQFEVTIEAEKVLWSSIFVTLMANKIGGLQFGIYRNCQISSRVFHTAVAALPLTKANRSDFE